MAFHKRELSRDITSNESRHATPLPTYYSQQLPRWTSKSAFEDQKAFNMNPEPQGTLYPPFVAPAPRFDDIPLPPRPQRQRFPRKTILIPWILASIFFLTTLWFISIALGVRLFMVLQPVPRSPPVQEIHIMFNEEMLSGIASTYTTFATLPASETVTTATVHVPTSTIGETVLPTITGQLVAAPIPNADPLEVAGDSEPTTKNPVPRDIKTNPTGFITMTRVL